MRILISAAGSHGDMLPFIGLGRALLARGHDVRLYGNGLFGELVSGAGLAFVETGGAQSIRDAQADRRVTRTRSGLTLVAQGVTAAILPTFHAMASDVLPGRTLLVGSSLAFAPRLLAEAQRLPFAVAHLAPSLFRSDHLAPRMSPLGHFECWPRIVKRATWALMDRRFLDPAFGRPLNEIRARLGLPAVRRVWHHWIHEATVTLGLFPEWLAPRQPDWPAGLKLTGFPMDRSSDAAGGLPPQLQAFIEAGPAPVVFTAGTANTRSEGFYAESVRACERLNLRGVMVARERTQLPEALPPQVVHVPYASFGHLFPRSAAVVHHGGIGTMSQALLAATPQLVRPMAYDQFDNASRACRLGVAQELLPRAYRGSALDKTLEAVLDDASMRAACARWGARMATEEGLRAACDALENTLHRQHA